MKGPQRSVVDRLSSDGELEMHISYFLVPGHQTYVELRWYSPELHRYARGIVFPKALLARVQEALNEIADIPDAT